MWTDLHPPEHFSFSQCRVTFAAVDYHGWIYYPHPETKRRNFQDASLLEVIAAVHCRVEHRLQARGGGAIQAELPSARMGTLGSHKAAERDSGAPARSVPEIPSEHRVSR